ncbi:MAG: hypothetical protein ACXVCY_19250 [Pseudobdellovibrionaceae bacterium]
MKKTNLKKAAGLALTISASLICLSASAQAAELRCSERLQNGSWTAMKANVVPGVYKDEQGDYGFVVMANTDEGTIITGSIFQGPATSNNAPKVSAQLNSKSLLLTYQDIILSCVMAE